MNVSKVEIYGTRGKSLRYLEQGNTVIFTELEAKVTGTVTMVAFDERRLSVEQIGRLYDVLMEGKIVRLNNLKYPIKLGFYGVRPR